jgi:hypothetical protein
MAKLTVLYPPCLADPLMNGNILDHRIANETIAAGKVVYELATGKVAVADAAVAGKHTPAGISVHQQYFAGQSVGLVQNGLIAGYDLSAKNVGTIIYLDTTGDLADTANATTTVACGRVVGSTKPRAVNDGTYEKLIWFHVNPNVNF